MLNVAYLQSIEELLSEQLDPTRLIDEIAITASDSGCENFRRAALRVLEDLRQIDCSAVMGSAAMLPGNAAFVGRALNPRFKVRLILLECREASIATRACIARYETLCEECGIKLHVLQSDWRRFRGRAKVAGKLAFENEILDALQAGGIDVLVLDRTMFYVGMLIAPGSPIAANVINSHPGLLSGPFRNAGKSPTLDALRMKRERGAGISGISVHRATCRVDVGEMLCERRFVIDDVHTPQQLRSRVYSGIEALAQMDALQHGTFSAVRWNERREIDVDAAERLYRAIQPPPSHDWGRRAS